MKRTLAILTVMGITAGIAQADIILEYLFTDESRDATTEHANVLSSDSFVTSTGTSNFITTASPPNSPALSSSGWSTSNEPSRYWLFGLELEPGWEFADSPDSLTLDFVYRATGTGPVNYQLDYDSGSGFTTLDSGTINNDSNWNSSGDIDLSALAGTSGSVQFRLGGYNADSSSGTWALDSVTLSGTMIPEPGTTALMLMGFLGIAAARRKLFKR